jgi:hypothetical protein
MRRDPDSGAIVRYSRLGVGARSRCWFKVILLVRSPINGFHTAWVINRIPGIEPFSSAFSYGT